MAVSIGDLLERRVPQYLAIYLGAGWAVIEFISFLENRFALSPLWTNLFLIAWALLIPSVVMFTYYHGRPGKDGWARAEKVGIPLNIVLAVVVLTSAFRGADLGPPTLRVTVTDESGEQVERTVAKASYRKRLAVFFFDAPASDTASAWLRAAVPIALSVDLSQDLFIDLRTPPQFKEQLRKAGVGDGYNVPLALKQQIAQELHLPHYVAGHAVRDANGYTLRMTLYETATGRVVKERTATNADLYAAIDELSVRLREDLELPTVRTGDVKDMPVAELLSPNADALRAFTESLAAVLRDDWSAGLRTATRASELDPSFAYAHYATYQLNTVRGDPQTGMPYLAKSMQHLYRLPERMQFLVKIENYFMTREMEKGYAVAAMMTELYPSDLQGLAVSAQINTQRGRYNNAITSLRKIVELDPQQQEVLLQIGGLQEMEGQTADALATYREYAKKFPTDAKAHLKAGFAEYRLGKLADARTSFDRALIADPGSIEAIVAIATLDRASGEFDVSLNRLQDALRQSRTAEDSARAVGGMQGYYDHRGQAKSMLRMMQQRVALAPRFLPPLQVLMMQMSMLPGYVDANETATAEATLARVRAQLTPPIDQFWQLGQLQLAMALRDSARLRESLAASRRIIDDFGIKQLESLYADAEGVLAETRGDWNAALQAYQRMQKLDPTAIHAKRSIARVYRNLGRLDDAQRMIDEHLRTMPASGDSNLEAARIKLARADKAGARVHLERAQLTWAAADPGYAAVAEVAKLLAEVGG